MGTDLKNAVLNNKARPVRYWAWRVDQCCFRWLVIVMFLRYYSYVSLLIWCQQNSTISKTHVAFGDATDKIVIEYCKNTMKNKLLPNFQRDFTVNVKIYIWNYSFSEPRSIKAKLRERKALTLKTELTKGDQFVTALRQRKKLVICLSLY